MFSRGTGTAEVVLRRERACEFDGWGMYGLGLKETDDGVKNGSSEDFWRFNEWPGDSGSASRASAMPREVKKRIRQPYGRIDAWKLCSHSPRRIVRSPGGDWQENLVCEKNSDDGEHFDEYESQASKKEEAKRRR